MKQIILGQDIAYAAKAGGGTIVDYREIDKLDTGALAVFTERGVLVTSGNVATVLDNQKDVYIAVGNQQYITGSSVDKAKSQLTGMIPRLDSSVTKQVYVSAIGQRTFIGSNGASGAFNQPSTLVAGTEAIVRLTKTTEGLRTIGAIYDNEVKRFSTTVLAGDTITTIANRIIDAINADTNEPFVTATAVGATTGIQLDTIDTHDTFTVSVDGILISATRTENALTGSNSRAITYAKGASWQMQQLELEYSTERGNTNQIWLAQFYYKTPSLVVSGATYDTYTIAYGIKRKVSFEVQLASHQEIVVAMPQGATQQSAFETIIAELFSMTNSPIETGS